MTPAEQDQELWTIYRCECGATWKQNERQPDMTHTCRGEPVEVVPAEESEMAMRYFPFMRRSRDEAVRKLSACQEERDAAGVEADEQRRERQAAETAREDAEAARDKLYEAWRREQVRGDDAETARDEAVKREKALRAAIEEHRDRDTFKSTKAEANRKLYAALDQSGKP